MSGAAEPARPDCMACRHFYVTWEPAHPRGCRAFGFKTRELPAVVVKRESGRECQAFEAKAKPSAR